jgi:tetratricopeptide (TPR) repeat protein
MLRFCRPPAMAAARSGEPRSVIPIYRSRLIAALMATAIVGIAVSPATAARRLVRPSDGGLSMTGGFLAGRLAASLRDNQAASTFYQTALRAAPNNLDLLDRTFLALVSSGDMDRAFRYAERLVAADKLHRIGRLTLGVRALKARQYTTARTNLEMATQRPVLDLIAPLLGAWADAGAGETAKGVDAVDKIKGEDWYTGFRDFSAGMAYDLAGDRVNAIKRLKAASDRDSSAVRIAEAYARALARDGQRDEALKVLKAYDEKLPRHPAVRALIADIEAGKPIASTVRNAQEGASDILVGLAAPLSKQGGTDYALIFYQLALYLNPDNASGQIGLADLYVDLKQP